MKLQVTYYLSTGIARCENLITIKTTAPINDDKTWLKVIKVIFEDSLKQ